MTAFPADWDTSYCRHGYAANEDCPDCDTPSYLPSYFNAVEEEAELSRESADMLHSICSEIDAAVFDLSRDTDFALLAAMNPSDFQ